MKKYLMSEAGAIVIGSILISLSILISNNIIRIRGLNDKALVLNPTATSVPTQQAAPPTDTGPVRVSVDDDPVLGDKDAPVTIIEFSDYECPFCKRHFEQTYTQLKKDYIDTGKVKLVFRDYPLPFHDPMASYEANAANCAKEQGGDSVYFKFHDELFKRTKSNGNGLTKDEVSQIATDLGLNSSNVKACADSDKYKDEIAKDLADGNSVGISGTPSFVIGKSSRDGMVEGSRIVGAQPLGVFQQTIDPLLK